MKNILSFSGLLCSGVLFAQIIINPGTRTTATNPSVSLEFGDEARGIILPYVDGSNAADAVAGTFIMDPSEKAVKLRLPDGTWQNLSGSAAKSNIVTNAASLNQESKTAKVIIGPPYVPQAQVPGILILSENDKAMILPKVASPHLNIKNPAAGMMVYDSAERILAVFNGTQWSFWKP